MYYVKLTNSKMETFGGFPWQLGKTEKTSGNGELCSEGWLHCYGAEKLKQAMALAVLLNPIHADFKAPRLFRVNVGGSRKDDNGLKFGFTELTLTKELKVPEVTLLAKVAFGILCTLEVTNEPAFVQWAEGWLSGRDRSERAAKEAWVVVRAAAVAVMAAAAKAAEVGVRAAAAAVMAAEAAAKAAAAKAAEEAWVGVRAAEAAAAAAGAKAVWSVESKTLNLGLLAEKALKIV